MDAFSSGTHLIWQSPLPQLCAALCVLGLLVHKCTQHLANRRRNPCRLPFPPGPKGHPFIGSMFDMPTSEQWSVYADWAKIYGDILSFEVLGQRMVVLNSLEAAQDLLEKRSAIYSDRPKMKMLFGLMGCDWNFGLMPYGSWWRRHRRTFGEHFNESVVWKFLPLQAKETRALLSRLLQSPEMFIDHIRESLSSSMINVAYGIQITGANDPYIVNAEESMKGIAIAAVPGSFLVDFIPALKYLPSWLPGGGFKKEAVYWAEVNRKVLQNPFNRVRQQMKEGTAGPSLAADLITALPEGNDILLAEATRVAQNVAAVTFVAGADTSISAIQSFMLAMAMYPGVQKKAQAELDAVIGPHRLPEFSDRPSLHYVNAMVKETMRWSLVVPLIMAHVSTEDDVYEGYFIPKGTMVFGNSWAILHDEKVFENPAEFRPEHYLKNGKLDPTVRQPDVSAFGFGRRICPGRFLSDNTLFSIVSSILHVFNITPALDENGVPVTLSNKMTSGIIVYPKPFKIDIKPRNAEAEALIRDGILADN